MQKLKRHGNGGSCFKKHEKLKIQDYFCSNIIAPYLILIIVVVP
jgi:hypothetical protein